MNLIARITILFVFVSLVVFLIGGVISFNVMMREVNFEQRRFLIERLDGLEKRLERRPVKDTASWTKLKIIRMPELMEDRTSFSDTVVMHNQLDRLEPHLRLDAVRTVDGVSYQISLYDIIIEPDDIRDGLVESLVTMYLILLGAVLIIGFMASYFILRPFNVTLDIIKNFSLTGSNQQVVFQKSNVIEFNRLNHFLEEMTNKVRSDYQSLKEFSENASHELQTPLAIVQSKLEVLMDGENLTEEQLEQISFVQSAIKRLSNLSNALALLTKIENREFENVSEVDLSGLLSKMLEEFKELIELKSIERDESITETAKIQADQVLIELMLTNLINNAIRHNWEGGKIKVDLNGSELTISNTGQELTIPGDQLFERFKKSNQSSHSMGLGLAIVKKICDYYDYEIGYEYKDDFHTIHIRF
ncbi:Signal transduction histidine kinase [Ekhidna lutea]|uniref:histidine kinase n=1 Tax=Ekhidna lutea TaxID=447679 RepID=A0A239L8G4_EKHLU|nr:HAMP domain-containing sensor histidine kinase [Ekhidna lutea]SNT26927.1 Signal transduction histidine kinase [Ekhidna lutea]